MIDKIIASYLSNNKRLVVPEFGAFIRKDGGELVFVEFLKKDDQVLTSLIGREYGLNETEAREAIEDYITTVKRTVGQTGKYVVAGVGSLHPDANGLYALDYNPSARKETAPAQHVTIGEQSTEPEMEVINARGHMPAVGEDILMEPREKTIIFPTRDEPIIAGLSAEEKTPKVEPPKEIEFRYREVETPAPAKKTTLNDIYSMPAAASKESRTEQSRPHPESQRPAAQRHHESPRSVQRQEPHAQRPTQRPVNYSSTPKKKIDLVMILAIVIAVIALGSVIYGIFGNRSTSADIRPTNPQIENAEAELTTTGGSNATK